MSPRAAIAAALSLLAGCWGGAPAPPAVDGDAALPAVAQPPEGDPGGNAAPLTEDDPVARDALSEPTIRDLMRRGEVAQARSAARALSAARPEQASAWMLLGEAEAQAGDPAAAASAYLEAIPLLKDPHPALFAAAAASEEAGARARALALYTRALQLPPNNPFEHLAVARVQEADALSGLGLGPWVGLRPQGARGDHRAALATVDAGLAAFPGDADLRVRHAHLTALMGDWDQALAELSGVLAEDSEHLGARFGRVETLILAGRPEEARAASQALVASLPDEADARLWSARALLASGARAAAAEEVAQGLTLAGDCPCTAEVRASLTELGGALSAGPPP